MRIAIAILILTATFLFGATPRPVYESNGVIVSPTNLVMVKSVVSNAYSLLYASNVTAKLKQLSNGANITITDNGTHLVVASTAAGHTDAQITNIATNAVQLSAGPNVTITPSGNGAGFTYTIGASLAGGTASMGDITNVVQLLGNDPTNFFWLRWSALTNLSLGASNWGNAISNYANTKQHGTANLSNWSGFATSYFAVAGMSNIYALASTSNLFSSATNDAYSYARSMTNGLAALSYTIGANSTGFVYSIGANGTNYSQSVTSGLAALSYSIGANNTNYSQSVTSGLAALSYSIGANSTNFSYALGANGTNYSKSVTSGLAALTYTIGSNATNHDNAILQAATNYTDSAISGTGTFTTNATYAFTGSIGADNNVNAGKIITVGGTNLYGGLVAGTNDAYSYARLTTGGLAALTYTIGANDTNHDNSILQSATNYTDSAISGLGTFTTNASYAFTGSIGSDTSINAKQSLTVGGTNIYGGLVAGTNDAYSYARLATGGLAALSYTIGANSTNYSQSVTSGLAALSYTIGANSTNHASVVYAPKTNATLAGDTSVIGADLRVSTETITFFGDQRLRVLSTTILTNEAAEEWADFNWGSFDDATLMRFYDTHSYVTQSSNLLYDILLEGIIAYNANSTNFTVNSSNGLYALIKSEGGYSTNHADMKQFGSSVLTNLSGLSSSSYTNSLLGGTNTSVRTAGGTNFIDTKGELNNWSLFTTNMVSTTSSNAAANVSFASTNVHMLKVTNAINASAVYVTNILVATNSYGIVAWGNGPLRLGDQDDTVDVAFTLNANTANLTNVTIAGQQGSSGQKMTSTGTGVAWQNDPGITSLSYGTTETVGVSSNSTVLITDAITGSCNVLLTNCKDRCYFVLRAKADGTARTVSFTTGGGAINWISTNATSAATNLLIPANKIGTVVGRVWIISTTTNVDLFANVQP